MHRVKHPPIRNKINLTDPAQLRAWTRRLGISADALKAVVGKVGNSVAAVTKEVELQRASRHASPAAVQAHLPKANYQRLLDRDTAGSPRLIDALYTKRRVTQLIPYRNGERALAFQPDE